MMMPWKKKKLIRKLAEAYGKEPDCEYYAGDMDWIRTYYDGCRTDSRDSFYVDETTWNDLNLDEVFRRINACQSTAGEQYLYYMLRRPADRKTAGELKGLIHLAEERPEIRQRVQLLLCGIGRERRMDLGTFFRPKDTSPFWLAMYLLLGMLFILSILTVPLFGAHFAVLPVILLGFNAFFHEYRRNRCEHQIRLVNSQLPVLIQMYQLELSKSVVRLVL